MNTAGVFYREKIMEEDSRGILKYNTQLVNCIEEACQYCIDTSNSTEESGKPIMMLGKIQSGKTRAYIGLISLAFDNDFDFILVLSKNSRALVTQTERRMKEEFRKFIDCGDVVVKNIQDMDDKKLKKYQLKQKQIVIAKKETRNLDRIERFIADNDINDKKKCLIIDDEADITSVGFTKIKGIDEFELRTISDKINNIRGSLGNCVFVQVTATPYALYLQSEYKEEECLPLRPSKTILVPSGEGYIGGDYYFNSSNNENHEGNYLFSLVSEEERIFVSEKLHDGRSYKPDIILTSKKLEKFIDGIFNFIVGGIIYKCITAKNKNLAYIIHTDTSKRKHFEEEDVINQLVEQIQERNSNGLYEIICKRIKHSYDDIGQSIKSYSFPMMSYENVESEFFNAFDEELLSTKIVNGEKQLNSIIDQDTGEITKDTPFSVFIGGQILDRGITISDLVGFYYGRNPKIMQQDTVMQHSRMFGYRSRALLSITRFYTTRGIYERLTKITEIEEELRQNIENGSAGENFYFITKDESGKIKPCSPTKIANSQIEFISPAKRTLPIGFNTIGKTKAAVYLRALDKQLEFVTRSQNQIAEITFQKATEILENIYSIIKKDEGAERFVSYNQMKDILQYVQEKQECKDMFVIIRKNRNVSKYKSGDKYTDAPDDGKNERKLANELSSIKPVLILLEQSGLSENGWSNCKFWWPILQMPQNAKKSIIALNEPKGKIRKRIKY